MNPRPPPGGVSGNLRYAAARGSLGAPVTLRPGSDPETLQDQLADIEGFSVETVCVFPAPPAGLVRSWVARCLQEDLPAGVAAWEKAIRRGRQRERRNR